MNPVKQPENVAESQANVLMLNAKIVCNITLIVALCGSYIADVMIDDRINELNEKVQNLQAEINEIKHSIKKQATTEQSE